MGYRAATIGRTGRGDYGHSLEMSWVGLPDVDYVAIADEDEAGRASAAERTGARAAYADYRQMLAAERPDLVAVAPRWLDCHADMAIACAEAGVRGVLCEKPLARSPAEADAMLEACLQAGTRIAIAHQARVTPPVLAARQMVQDGAIGRLLTMQAAGKEDVRGGGEDLMVLGTHFLDLMCFFAGRPSWCMADVTVGGRPLAPKDVRLGPEGIGPMAGDQVLAVYGFDGGVRGQFRSFRGLPGGARRMGVDLYGSEGILSIRGSNRREVYWLRSGLWAPGDQSRWEAVEVPSWEALPVEQRLVQTNRWLAWDLVRAVEEGREPVSSGADGRVALEMILAAYASAIHGRRVALPLASREHPLERLHIGGESGAR
ncbi:MAG: Gfo/Idh/MocA family oxidoreductase [Anaerolineae bacterium]|nr:Gfo/Idh/MocA family oxidoreductase [Anaerolineae bacterium]